MYKLELKIIFVSYVTIEMFVVYVPPCGSAKVWPPLCGQTQCSSEHV